MHTFLKSIHRNHNDTSIFWCLSQICTLILSSAQLSGCLSQGIPHGADNSGIKPKTPDQQCQEQEYTEYLLREQEFLETLLQQRNKQIARLNLELLEKKVTIQQLRKRHWVQEQELDDTSHKAVRAEVKLRRMTGQADSASRIAEVEIALRDLKEKLSGKELNPQVLQAERFLGMSTREFKNDNYAKAVEFTEQAREFIDTAESNLENQHSYLIVAKEIPFDSPISLRVKARSNLREAPDRRSKILKVLEKETPVIAHAYQGQWVRVETQKGKIGWVFRTLLMER